MNQNMGVFIRIRIVSSQSDKFSYLQNFCMVPAVGIGDQKIRLPA